MEEMSSNILSGRKRKRFSPSMSSFKSSMGSITRRQYHSGRAYSDNSFPQDVQQWELIPDASLKKPESIHCPILENGASFLSIKDLRARARRVYSPTGIIERKNELGIDSGGEISNGSLKIMENGGDLGLGLKNSELGSGSSLGFCEKREKSLGSKNSDLGMENKRFWDEKDVAANKINQADDVYDCCENPKKGSISTSGMVRKPGCRGKVYKSPNLFSYRRLLPFLANIVKEESCATRPVEVDADLKVKNSLAVDSSSSGLDDSMFVEHEHIDEDSNGTRPPYKGHFQKIDIQHEVKVLSLHVPENELPHNDAKFSLINVQCESHENGSTEGDERIEENVQTTPPESTILSEFGVRDTTDANAEVTDLKTLNPVLVYPSNGINCNSHVSGLKGSYPSPTRRNKTISTAKLVLNPCSRSKLYKTSSSFSYRRLLPYLMDVAKGSAHNNPSPKFQKDVDSSQHLESSSSLDNDTTLNENEACDFQEKKQPNCQELDVLTSRNAHSGDDLSGGNCLEPSTPVISSSSEISLGKPSFTCSENMSELHMLNGLVMENGSPQKQAELNKTRKFEGDFHNADIRVCDDEGDRLIETSCSGINHKNFPEDSWLEISNHQPADNMNCNYNDLVYHEDKSERVESVTLNRSSSKNGEFQFQETESPTKGILKRNPRGCRGLCHCLNCTSFRLHAERAFEYSRNQMLYAEEVALMLIKEVGELRVMLEKSAVDGRDLVAVESNQVRESCKKAVGVEELARQRLSQMKEDLKVHCRTSELKRPRVRFSSYIQVKSIPQSKSSKDEGGQFI